MMNKLNNIVKSYLEGTNNGFFFVSPPHGLVSWKRNIKIYNNIIFISLHVYEAIIKLNIKKYRDYSISVLVLLF
jgi:hypothetical protein